MFFTIYFFYLSAKGRRDDRGEFAGIFFDLCLVLPLDHHSSKVFRSGISQQEPALPVQSLIDITGGGGNFRNGPKRPFLSYLYVDQHLRIPDKSLCSLRQSSLFCNKGVQHEKGSQHPVSHQAFMRKNYVSRLFASDRSSSLQEFVQNIFITNLSSGKFDVSGSESDLESQVAHNGRYDLVVRKATFVLEPTCKYPKSRIPVDNISLFVHEKSSVGIAVVCNSDISFIINDSFL